MFESLVKGRRQRKYTVEQAFRGIQAFVTENCGAKIVLDSNAPLTNYEQAARNSHECPLQFLEDLARYFQFEWSESRWGIWLQLRDNSLKTKRERQAAWEHWQQAIAPQITVRKLAELVARKARVPSFEPVTILGSRCEPAGVFLGLCCLPETEKGRYSPSTPLRALKSSRRIRDLWKRAEWINGVKLPPLDQPSPWRFKSTSDGLQFLSIVATIAAFIIACWRVAEYDWRLAFFAGCMAALAALIVGGLITDRVHNPLPEGIERFGDLARLIVKQRRQPT